MEYGCWDCPYTDNAFLDAWVVFLLVMPVAIASLWIAYRILKWIWQLGGKGQE